MKKNKKEKDNLSIKFWILLVSIIFILLLIIICGFVINSKNEPDVIVNKENGGNVKFIYSSSTSALSLSNAVPTTDNVGKKIQDANKYFDFSVDVKLDNAKKVEYEITLVKDDVLSTIPDNEIRLYLEKEKDGTYTKISDSKPFTALDKNTKIGSKKGSMVIYKEIRTNSGVDYYRLRMWLSDKSVIPNGSYSVEVNVLGRAID